MQEQGLELGSRLDLDPAEALIVDAFAGQRRRLLATARQLTASEWTQLSRCAEWNAHELVLHVVGATQACCTTLNGEHAVFGETFDPNSAPNAFVDLHAGQPVATTIDALEESIDATVAEIERQRTRTPGLRVPSIWGEEIDWRLFVTHMFFDGWIHERDLLLPLGRDAEGVDDEVRLATAYALNIAAKVAALFQTPVDTTLRLDGPGSGSYRIVVDGVDVLISVSALDDTSGPVNGNAAAVTDVITGRGPELGAVLDAEPEIVDALSGVGAFLRG